MSTLPARPRLVLRAGFAGRKELTDAEEKTLKSPLAKVFTTLGHKLAALTKDIPVEVGKKPKVADYLAPTPPLLRLITGLCEGADFLAAEALATVNITPDPEPEPADAKPASAPASCCLVTELAAVLPFDVETYRTSRPAGFRPQFDRQLASCAWVLALDGIFEKPDPPTKAADHRRARAYRAQGAFLLRQSDLLIAAADPTITAKAGGTLETVREAQIFGLPVVFIHTGTGNVYLIAPEEDLHDVLAGDPPSSTAWQEKLREWVFQLTADPDSGVEPDEHHHHEARENAESLLKEFFDASGSPQAQSARAFIRYRKWAWNWFEKRFRSGPGPSNDPRLAPYAVYRDRATELNYHYSGIYRGAFLLNYIFAIGAVALAALSLALLKVAADSPWLHPVLFGLATVKLGLVILIARNTNQANKNHWNDRAVGYRYLAERLRGMYYLPQLGSQQPPAASPQEFSSRVIHQSIVDWLFDAIVRSVSLADLQDITLKDVEGTITAILFAAAQPVSLPTHDRKPTHDGKPMLIVKKLHTAQPLQAVVNVRDRWILGQVNYHAGEARTKHALHHFLETAAKWLGFTVIAIVALDLGITLYEILHGHHLLPASFAVPGWMEFLVHQVPWFIAISALLPAVIAALGGIRFQSECQRLAERSGVMRVMLAGQEPRKTKLHPGRRAGVWESVGRFYPTLRLVLRHLAGRPPLPPPTPTPGGRYGRAGELIATIEGQTKNSAADPGSWAHPALRFTESTATLFVHEAAEWSVLYAKDVSDPG